MVTVFQDRRSTDCCLLHDTGFRLTSTKAQYTYIWISQNKGRWEEEEGAVLLFSGALKDADDNADTEVDTNDVTG